MMKPGGNFSPPYTPDEKQRACEYGEAEVKAGRKPDWEEFARAFSTQARAEGRPERSAYGLEQLWRARDRNQKEGQRKARRRGRGRPPKKQPTPEPAPGERKSRGGGRHLELTDGMRQDLVKIACRKVREVVHPDYRGVREEFNALHPERPIKSDDTVREVLKKLRFSFETVSGRRPRPAIVRPPEDLLAHAKLKHGMLSEWAVWLREDLKRRQEELDALMREIMDVNGAIRALGGYGEEPIARLTLLEGQTT